MNSDKKTKSRAAPAKSRSTASRNVARPAGADRPDRQGKERAEHVDAFKKRQLRPGKAGLANEPRPGLGTRASKPGVERKEGAPLKPWRTRAVKAAKKYQEPRPAPQEEPADDLLQAQERSTGMSGQSAGT